MGTMAHLVMISEDSTVCLPRAAYPAAKRLQPPGAFEVLDFNDERACINLHQYDSIDAGDTLPSTVVMASIEADADAMAQVYGKYASIDIVAEDVERRMLYTVKRKGENPASEMRRWKQFRGRRVT